MSLLLGDDRIEILGGQMAATILAREDGAAIGSRVEQESLSAVLARLLDDAREAILRDRDTALACIVRASALLRTQRGRDDSGQDPVPAALVRGGLAPWQIIRIKAHVEAHLDSVIRMRDLAVIARLSSCHFARSFTRSFGMSPFAYITGRRLARAQHLMLTTDDPLSQIALACGLYDQSHLARLFRRHLGTSPNVWRRHHRGEPSAPFDGLPMSGLQHCEALP
jgi:transcriptional regulator GlxA family with amidase domain